VALGAPFGETPRVPNWGRPIPLPSLLSRSRPRRLSFSRGRRSNGQRTSELATVGGIQPFRRTPPSWLVFGLIAGYLVATHIAVYIVDLRRAGTGVHAWMAQDPNVVPYLWVHIFQEAGPTEFLQWGTLGLLAVVAGAVGGALNSGGGPPTIERRRAERAGRFWRIFGFAAALMLVEDAGNVRHVLVRYARVHFEGGVTNVTTLTEVGFYALLGAVPMYAVLRYGRHVWHVPATRWFGLAGVVAYAVASISSATRYLGDWYQHAGLWVRQVPMGDQLPPVEAWEGWRTHFYLMDYLVEESLELLGASLLLAAAVGFARHHRPVGTLAPDQRTPAGNLPPPASRGAVSRTTNGGARPTATGHDDER
jgi:hypothetical protein